MQKWREIEVKERALPVAQLTALVRNLFLEKEEKPFTAADFIPGMKEPIKKKQQTPEDMLAVVKLLNAAYGGEVIN